jgi:hypothetical protein
VNALRNSFPRRSFLGRLFNCEKGLSASLHSPNVRLPFLLCRLDPFALVVDFLTEFKNSTLSFRFILVTRANAAVQEQIVLRKCSSEPVHDVLSWNFEFEEHTGLESAKFLSCCAKASFHSIQLIISFGSMIAHFSFHLFNFGYQLDVCFN